MPRTLTLGDIHGNYKALKQCLERSKFDYENDRLIQLGDIVDRGPESYECIEELLKIKNLICITGNHDYCWFNWIIKGSHYYSFLHGGNATVQSYIDNNEDWPYNLYIKQQQGGYVTNLTKMNLPASHMQIFNRQVPYYIDENNNCFVHGGFDRHEKLKNQDPEEMMFDRSLVKSALSYKSGLDQGKFNMVDDFKSVFVGHSPTIFYKVDKSTEPVFAGNVIMMDTGAGFPKGKMSIMDVDTKEFWQSDIGSKLYDNFKD